MGSLAGPFPFGLSLLLGQNRGGSGEEVGIACARHSAAELTTDLASTVEGGWKAVRLSVDLGGGGCGGGVGNLDGGESEVVGVVMDNYSIAC